MKITFQQSAGSPKHAITVPGTLLPFPETWSQILVPGLLALGYGIQDLVLPAGVSDADRYEYYVQDTKHDNKLVYRIDRGGLVWARYLCFRDKWDALPSIKASSIRQRHVRFAECPTFPPDEP